MFSTHKLKISFQDLIAKDFNINLLAKMPIDSKMAELCDNGEIEKVENNSLMAVIDLLESMEISE